MKTNQHPGKLIAFCGIDGCGKTTQIYNLKNFIEQQNKQVFLAESSAGFVMDSKTLPEASDRIQYSDRVIAKHLADGDIVISEMPFYSHLANLLAGGYTDDVRIREITELILKPDIAFFLDVNVETAINRVRQREIDTEFQYTLRNEFLKLAKENGGIIINADRSMKDTFSSILQVVLGTLNIDRRVSNDRR